MQELFSKVNTEKRHLYGENGILGHRRAISTTIPAKKPSGSGHRRTYSNTSSDFKAIFCTSPALLKQIEQASISQSKNSNSSKNPSAFTNFLETACKYFTNNILPEKFSKKSHKLKNQIIELTDSISLMQKDQIKLINQKNELKSKIKFELDYKSNSDVSLQKSKKRTNELEIALKSAQEEIKNGKILTAELMKKIEFHKDSERSIFTSLQIDTNEEFALQKSMPRTLYGGKMPVFPLTPSAKQFPNKSGSISPI